MVRSGEDFLALLGGADLSILSEVPRERTRFVQQALVLLTTASIAAVSMAFALHDGVGTPTWTAIIGGLAWGFAILNLDRFLVLSIRPTRRLRELLTMALPRLFLSVVTSVIISAPLTLRIFMSEINAQLVANHAGRGLLAQLQALDQISARNPTVQVGNVTIIVFFFLISVLPVLVKILLSLGPRSAYETLLKEREEEVIVSARHDRRDLAASLNNLGARYASLGRTDEALQSTRDAVKLYRELARDNPAVAADLAGSLSNLGTLYSELNQTDDALAVTQEAVELYRNLAKTNPRVRPELAASLSNLGGIYGELNQTDDALVVTREAVELYRSLAVPERNAEISDLTATSANLAATLQSRFRSTGTMDDLKNAIELLEQALTATPTSHPDRPVLLSNLAAALQSRYRTTEEPADLEKAIELLRQAIAAAPAAYPDRPVLLSNLAAALQTRYRDTGSTTDLQIAIDLLQQALAAAPAGHVHRPTILSKLTALFSLAGSSE